jgi:hypothetical protein
LDVDVDVDLDVNVDVETALLRFLAAPAPVTLACTNTR